MEIIFLILGIMLLVYAVWQRRKEKGCTEPVDATFERGSCRNSRTYRYTYQGKAYEYKMKVLDRKYPKRALKKHEQKKRIHRTLYINPDNPDIPCEKKGSVAFKAFLGVVLIGIGIICLAIRLGYFFT